MFLDTIIRTDNAGDGGNLQRKGACNSLSEVQVTRLRVYNLFNDDEMSSSETRATWVTVEVLWINKLKKTDIKLCWKLTSWKRRVNWLFLLLFSLIGPRWTIVKELTRCAKQRKSWFSLFARDLLISVALRWTSRRANCVEALISTDKLPYCASRNLPTRVSSCLDVERRSPLPNMSR